MQTSAVAKCGRVGKGADLGLTTCTTSRGRHAHANGSAGMTAWARRARARLCPPCGIAATLVLALACCSFFVTAGLAQIAGPPTANLRSNNVSVDYLEPKDPKLQAIYERVKGHKVLEEYSGFLSPLRLPVTLRLKTLQCDTDNAFYESTYWAVHMCYELFEGTVKRAPKTTMPDGTTRGEFIAGDVASTLLHETGHALNDILNLPVLGREEDAADQMSAFIMLQFGKDVARMAIKATYHSWMSLSGGPKSFWDVHSTGIQRAQNYLCLGYGADPDTFRDLAMRNALIKDRLPRCAHEYQQLRSTFVQTVLPYLDKDLMAKVQARRWLRPEEYE
jgi:hypothetical protein